MTLPLIGYGMKNEEDKKILSTEIRNLQMILSVGILTNQLFFSISVTGDPMIEKKTLEIIHDSFFWMK